MTTIGAFGLTALSPVSKPTFAGPYRPIRSLNF